VLDDLQSIDRHVLTLQVGEYLGFPRGKRHLVASKVLEGVDAGVGPDEQGQWRVLEDRGEYDNGIASGIAQDQLRGRDAEVGAPFQHGVDGVRARAQRDDRDRKAGLTVVALLESRVEAGELKLMAPLELQAHWNSPGGGRLARTDIRRDDEQKNRVQNYDQRGAARGPMAFSCSNPFVAHSDRRCPGARIVVFRTRTRRCSPGEPHDDHHHHRL
jgi:hypothetical protein